MLGAPSAGIGRFAFASSELLLFRRRSASWILLGGRVWQPRGLRDVRIYVEFKGRFSTSGAWLWRGRESAWSRL